MRLLEMGRVAVVDIDYHHGNGTQRFSGTTARVLRVDPRRPAEEYPYFTGYSDETAASKPRRYPERSPALGAAEDDYLPALERLLAQAADFKPASLVVSLGFDTFTGDPLGTFKLTGESYARIGTMLAGLRLPTLLVQEGGYNVEALGALAEHLLRGMCSD